MKSSHSADVVICGAGIAGVSAAYHLAVRHGVKHIVLVDERPPLTLTSDKGTEAYRNWWPGPDDTMVRFMNRSIDLLEELTEQTAFNLNRRGYVFVTSSPERFQEMKKNAVEISSLGAGELRFHPGSSAYTPSPAEEYRNLPTGADIIEDRELIQRHFPFLGDDVVGLVHARRCGWLDAKRLGTWLLQEAQAAGVRIVEDCVERVPVQNNRVETIHLASGADLNAGAFVIAAGPYVERVGAMLGVEIPVFNELHAKISFSDSKRIIPRDVPMMILNDPAVLPWGEVERKKFAADNNARRLLEQFPGGVHVRTRGGIESDEILLIWTYDMSPQEPIWPPAFDTYYAEILIRGLSRMIPQFSVYFGQGSKAFVDGGYYCKTRENRPLIGPLPVRGAFVIGALSGFGIMASQAAADLLSAHVTGSDLPEYAPAFSFDRYENAAYSTLLHILDSSSGQL